MITDIYKTIFLFLLVVGLCVGFYLLGRSHAEVKIVKEKGEEIIKEVEVIKYVEQKKANIWSKSNASDSELIGLFLQGEL